MADDLVVRATRYAKTILEMSWPASSDWAIDLARAYLAVVAERDGLQQYNLNLGTQLAAMTAERDALRRVNDSLVLIISPEGETAETLNYEIADVADLQAQLAASEAALLEWRECAQYDALMGGAVFKGWNRSALDRCRRKTEALAEPLGEPFQKVLDDNRWDLYARSEPRKDGHTTDCDSNFGADRVCDCGAEPDAEGQA